MKFLKSKCFNFFLYITTVYRRNPFNSQKLQQPKTKPFTCKLQCPPFRKPTRQSVNVLYKAFCLPRRDPWWQADQRYLLIDSWHRKIESSRKKRPAYPVTDPQAGGPVHKSENALAVVHPGHPHNVHGTHCAGTSHSNLFTASGLAHKYWPTEHKARFHFFPRGLDCMPVNTPLSGEQTSEVWAIMFWPQLQQRVFIKGPW